MHSQSLSVGPQSNGTRAWKYGKSPMPEWIQDLAGNVESNGTFSLPTNSGPVRVHPGSVVIERGGSLWVRSVEEAPALVESLEESMDSMIMNIGPGKACQFGTSAGSKSRVKTALPKANNQRSYPSPIGSPPSIEWIHLNTLSVDSAYQRSTENAASRRLIAGITAKFDWRLCAPLVVSRRADDKLVIIDGQHRWLAARSRDDIAHLPCCVFRYKDTQEEARMFILANRARKPISRLDDFYAAVAAGDEDALEIQQLVTDAGLCVARSSSSMGWRPGEVAFTSSIANAIRRFGPASTTDALKHMSAAFFDQKLLHGAALLGALVLILSKAEADFDPDRLKHALRTKKLDEWGLVAAGLKCGDYRVAALRKAIMEAYDKPS